MVEPSSASGWLSPGFSVSMRPPARDGLSRGAAAGLELLTKPLQVLPDAAVHENVLEPEHKPADEVGLDLVSDLQFGFRVFLQSLLELFLLVRGKLAGRAD